MSSDFLARFKNKINKLSRNGEMIINDDCKIKREITFLPTAERHLRNSSSQATPQFSSRVITPILSNHSLIGVISDPNTYPKTKETQRSFSQVPRLDLNTQVEQFSRNLGVKVIDLNDKGVVYSTKSNAVQSIIINRVTALPIQLSSKIVTIDRQVSLSENSYKPNKELYTFRSYKPAEDLKKETLGYLQQNQGVLNSILGNKNWSSKYAVGTRRRNQSERLLKQRGMINKSRENTHSLIK